jgi:hypothetical protein
VVEQLSVFADLFSDSQLLDGYIARVEIPKYTGSVEVVHRSHIHVTGIDQQGLKLEALDAYTNLYQKRGLSNRYAYRMPGIVQVSDAVLEQGLIVNRAKDTFRAAMRSIPKGSRARVRDQVLDHSLNLTYINRDIPIIEDPLESIKFQWEGKSYAQTRLSRDEAVQLIHQGSPLTATIDQVGDIADINLKKIANLDPAHTIVHRVLSAPSVYVNAKQLDGAWLSRMRCALPIMTAHALPFISVLGGFDAPTRATRTRRDTARTYIELIPALNLYYLEAIS